MSESSVTAAAQAYSAPLIYGKMSNILKEIGAVGKDSVNTQQGFKFRGVDAMINALNPALAKHRVFMCPRVTRYDYDVREVTRSNGKFGVDKYVTMLIEYDFFAEDGSKVTIGPIAAEGLDSGDKATNKALSAGLKYALIQTYCVATIDMVDADSDSPEMGSSASPKAKEVAPRKTEAQITAEAATKTTGKASIPFTNPKKAVVATPAVNAGAAPKTNVQYDL